VEGFRQIGSRDERKSESREEFFGGFGEERQ
jgi:hypothetical protein